MKYFTYILKPYEGGGLIGPQTLLPEDCDIGHFGIDPSVYYGSANIDSITVMSEFSPVELTVDEYNVSAFIITGSIVM